MNPFLYYSLVAIVTAFVWTLLMLSADQRNRQWLGLAGAWAAALVLVSLWQADNIPWLLDFIQLVMLIWLGAMILLVMAAASAWSEQESQGRSPISCATICMVINVAALLHFLWLATVDAGGV